jgi:glycerol-3-phosphate dehydrogenase (NAD(P)+)
MTRLSILGAGSWGTALAIVLAPRFEVIHLWARRSEQAAALSRHRVNLQYLPGFSLPLNIAVSNEAAAVAAQGDLVIMVVPSKHMRAVMENVAPGVRPGVPVISATKGIENNTIRRMSEVIVEALGSHSPVAVLSGPTFAKEVAAGEPAALVLASENQSIAAKLQRLLSGSTFRVYQSDDVVGVEIGGALKNVIAIAAGVCEGLGLGSNTRAALITRGLAEITRLAVAIGGRPRTLAGLAGLGDLVLTSTGDLSRNRSVGIRLGCGETLDSIQGSTTMVAEGVLTARAAWHLAQKLRIEAPILEQMFAILYENKAPRLALVHLMERPLTSE